MMFTPYEAHICGRVLGKGKQKVDGSFMGYIEFESDLANMAN